ncbi:MAG: GNAT family N-acetyltransferase [Sphingomonas bacterium]|nr:GNAT family N-acetyltransferase [Sphingomonas bacterium]
MKEFTHRLARIDDLDALRELMHRAIEQLQSGFLDPAGVRASHRVMGLDTQLIRDGTYFLALDGETIVGSGGWSCRATLYGGDSSIVARTPAMLDPASDAARIRAMYTNPDYVRRGVGRLVLALCEAAARANGFRRTEMMATMAGEPLYRASGYLAIERIMSRPIGGVRIPLIRMGKELPQ